MTDQPDTAAIRAEYGLDDQGLSPAWKILRELTYALDAARKRENDATYSAAMAITRAVAAEARAESWERTAIALNVKREAAEARIAELEREVERMRPIWVRKHRGSSDLTGGRALTEGTGQ